MKIIGKILRLLKIIELLLNIIEFYWYLDMLPSTKNF